MPVQNSLPANNTRSQRHQAVLTPTSSSFPDCTPSVHQLSKNLDRGPPMEGASPSRRGGVKSRISRSFSGLLGGYPSTFQGPRSSPEASEASNIDHSNQPFVAQVEPNYLNMMEQMTQLMGKLTHAVVPRENSNAPSFKTPSMKPPDSFDGTQAHKLRGFVPCFQFIFHGDPANLFSYRKKVLYSTSLPPDRALK
ncbi:hypothetical protein O181_042350 [Austropuccinia psidii MF-1]|uniref:Uncharacterized protein n=1 Tax=Austropuccinia psidii MF-1 TaxID=1389203 RepID=A0A9Q3DGI6_9BASI|nr:hypothetical protein [Austropuccinia psidii MF-1]